MISRCFLSLIALLPFFLSSCQAIPLDFDYSSTRPLSEPPTNPATEFLFSLDWPGPHHIYWSPDSGKIAMTGVAAGGSMLPESKTFVYDLETRELTIILESEKIADLYIVDSWSPDGEYLLVEEGSGFEPSLMLYDLSNDTLSRWFQGEGASWASSGLIAFSRPDRSLHIDRIYLYDTISNQEMLLSEFENTQIFDLSWSSDEKYLIYSYRPWDKAASSNFDILSLELETGAIQSLVDDANLLSPAASPASNLVAFVELHPYSKTDTIPFAETLHIVKIDGACDYEIPGIRSVWAPAWSPDGTKIAFVVGNDIYLLDLKEEISPDFPASGIPCE